MKAVLALVAACFLWGLNFHLLKVMLSYVHFIEAGFWRYVFGVIALTLLYPGSLPSLRLIKSHIKGVTIVGIGGLFSFNLLLFSGLKYTSSLNASLIISLSPVATIILSSIFLKTSVTLLQLLGASLSILGVLILLSAGQMSVLMDLSFSKGDILIVLATLLSACYHIWVKKYAEGISNQQFTLLTNLICLMTFICILPYCSVSHSKSYSTEFWLTSIFLGCIGTALTYSLWVSLR